MIMKTNGSLAWRWNHMRLTVRQKHACVCIHIHRPTYSSLMGSVCVCVRYGGGFQCGLCVFVSAYFDLCDCLLMDDRNKNECVVPVFEVFMCESIAFFVCCVLPPWLVTFNLWGLNQNNNVSQWLQMFNLGHNGATIFQVLQLSVKHLKEWQKYTFTITHLPLQESSFFCVWLWVLFFSLD